MDKQCYALEDMKRITISALDLLNKNFEAFLHHRIKEQEKAAQLTLLMEEEIRKQINRVFQVKLEEPEAISHCADALSFFSYLAKINYNLGKINENVKNKIKEGIMFSDKAAHELKEIFSGASMLLQHIHDILMTGNKVLIKHVADKSMELWNLAQDYATEHEERLIKGICLPKASVSYLLILDSLKDILWYEREIIKCIEYDAD